MMTKTYYGNAAVYGGKHLGKINTDSIEKAVAWFEDQMGPISLCHQCSGECEDGEATDLTVSDEDGNVIYTEKVSPLVSREEAIAALRELVEIRDLHEAGGGEKVAEYMGRKPAAWAEARRIVALSTPTSRATDEEDPHA